MRRSNGLANRKANSEGKEGKGVPWLMLFIFALPLCPGAPSCSKSILLEPHFVSPTVKGIRSGVLQVFWCLQMGAGLTVRLVEGSRAGWMGNGSHLPLAWGKAVRFSETSVRNGAIANAGV